MKEVWKELPGYKGMYKISNLGRTKKKDNPPIEHYSKKRYPGISLTDKGVTIKRSLHRVVWIAFNGGIPEKMEINHRDGDKNNNYLSNLELVTRHQNIRHSYKIGLHKQIRGSKNCKSIFSLEDVKNIKKLLREGVSQYRLCRDFKCSSSTINNISSGRTYKDIKC